jgi:hypothetical protein
MVRWPLIADWFAVGFGHSPREKPRNYTRRWECPRMANHCPPPRKHRLSNRVVKRQQADRAETKRAVPANQVANPVANPVVQIPSRGSHDGRGQAENRLEMFTASRKPDRPLSPAANRPPPEAASRPPPDPANRPRPEAAKQASPLGSAPNGHQIVVALNAATRVLLAG